MATTKPKVSVLVCCAVLGTLISAAVYHHSPPPMVPIKLGRSDHCECPGTGRVENDARPTWRPERVKDRPEPRTLKDLHGKYPFDSVGRNEQ